MEGSGNYIGTPCAVVLCVDGAQSRISGELYHGYSRDGIPFNGVEDAFLLMEDFFNRLKYPFPGTESRSFLKKQHTNGEAEMTRMMGDAELLKNTVTEGRSSSGCSTASTVAGRGGHLGGAAEDRTLPLSPGAAEADRRGAGRGRSGGRRGADTDTDRIGEQDPWRNMRTT